MTPGEFIETFDMVAEAPGGIERLRELVLQLAVRGRLVPQDGGESPISILERNAKEKRCLVDQRKIGKPKSLPRLSSDEVPFNVPETWKWIRLGDVALVVMGNSPPGSSYNEQGLGVPLINGPVEFSAGAFGLTICRKYTTKPNQMCMTGDMLICVRGATTGRTNIAAFDACIGRGVALVRAWEAQQYVNLYLWYVGKELLAAGKGTTFPSISYADLAGKPLPLPPLAEQHRIVAKVDELMGLIDRLESARRSRENCRTAGRDSALAALRNAATAEEVGIAWTRIAERMDDLFIAPADLTPLREAVLQLAVRGRLVSQELTDEPASVLLNRIAKEKTRRDKRIKTRKALPTIRDDMLPFEIPVSWEWTHLGEITSYGMTGKAEPSEVSEETWVLELEDIEKVSSRLLNRVRYGVRPFKSTKNRFYKGDILYGKLRPYLDKVVLADEDGVCSSEIMPIRGFVGLAPQFIRLVLKSPYFVQYANSSTHGMNLPRLGTDRARQALFPLPPEAEQHRIVAKVDELMGLIDRLEQHLGAKEGIQGELAVAWTGRVETRMQ